SLTWNTEALPTGGSVRFSARYNVDGIVWSNWLSATQTAINSTNGSLDLSAFQDGRYLEIKLDISSSDATHTTTPVINDFSLSSVYDKTSPSNPNSVTLTNSNLQDLTVYRTDDQGDYVDINGVVLSDQNDVSSRVDITQEQYFNNPSPAFKFDGAIDPDTVLGSPVDSSGVAGYYVYFGSDPSANAYTAGRYIEHNGSSNQWFGPTVQYPINLTTNGTYYFRIATKDNNGNISTSTALFAYKFDKNPPSVVNNINVSPFGWSSNKLFSFNWAVSTDELGSDNSGVSGYQYRINGNADSWSGTIYNTSNNQAVLNNLPAIIPGTNKLYIRSIDNAGNVSEERQISFYFTGNAPSAPTGLSIDKQNSITNSFTFQWSAPDAQISPYVGTIIGYRYSLGVVPNKDNSVFIDTKDLNNLPASVTYNAGVFTLANLAAATQQGINTFYIVAVGSDGNSGELVSYASGNTATVGFECNTPAPNAPTGVSLFDTSNKDSQAYSIAVKWTEPTNKGVGFSEYIVYRSTDGINFSQIGTSNSISFIDFGSQDSPLLSIEYYYKVLSRDNSGNISLTPANIPSMTPTGTYSSAPDMYPAGTISTVIGVSTVQFSWGTKDINNDAAHTASSFVDISESEVPAACDAKVEFSFNDKSMTSNHIIKATGLKPETKYNYRVRWFDTDGNCGKSDNLTFTTKPLPRITSMAIQDIRLYTAILTWSTSEPVSVDLLYGKTTNYSQEIKNVSGGATTLHTFRLDGLDHSSTYNLAIRITDIDGSSILSDNYSFDTLQYPKLSNVKFQPMTDQSTSTFKITWDSNVPTTSVVEYSPEGGKSQEAVKTKLDLKHEIIISGLFDNTFYLINTVGVDQYGNRVVSDLQRVKTNFDTRPPLLTSPSVEVSSTDFGAQSKSQVVVSWETDEPSTSQVEYGVGVTGENYDNKSQEDALLTTSHVVIITGLSPSSAYHLRAISSDASGNRGVSEQESILTEQARSSILDVIIGSLQSSLGWLFGMK
ncbi:MAG: fibronectin type III domain-containing protein, partial [Candidatus Saccharibacteria bacterium]